MRPPEAFEAASPLPSRVTRMHVFLLIVSSKHVTIAMLAWQLPFPGDTASGGAIPVPAAAVVQRICTALKDSHTYWQYLVRHCPQSVGSLALELIIILDDHSQPHVLCSSTPGSYVRACLRTVLHRSGAAARPAARMADAVAMHVMDVNTRTLGVCTTLSQRTDDQCIILRVSIKAAALISINPGTQKVWFRAGHANVAIVNTAYNNIILVEPAGRVLIQSLDLLLLRHLVHADKKHMFQVYTNFHMLEAAPDDNLCTIWCAVYGMLCLANNITSQKQLYSILEWAALRRKLLLRLFLGHAQQFL